MKTNGALPLNVCVITLLFVAAHAGAQSTIKGDVTFTGQVALNGPPATANSVTGYESPKVQPSPNLGSFSPLATGVSVTFDGFSFSPSPKSPVEFWSFVFANKTYAFDITSVNVLAQGPNYLSLDGNGFASITGDANTPGSWSIVDNSGNLDINVIVPSVLTPEPGTAALVFGALGSFGLARLARRRR